MQKNKRWGKIFTAVLLLVAMISTAVLMPLKTERISAEERRKVKVGFLTDMDSMMQMNLSTGIKSGYGYEYLRMVSYYTNWDYNYEIGNWHDLWEMLNDGEIDALVDVSYTEKRAENLLFPNLEYSMGKEVYYLYALNSNSSLISDDLKECLDGKKVGVTGKSLQESLMKEKIQELGSNCEVVVFTTDNFRNDAFQSNKVDFIVESKSSELEGWNAFYEMGTSECYLAFAPGREELVNEFNYAMRQMYRVNPTCVNDLYNEYYSEGSVNATLSEFEEQWAHTHSEIRLGYLTDDMSNPHAKEILMELIAQIQEKLGLKELGISIKEFDNYSEMKEALDSDEIDLVYPMIDDEYEAEKSGYMIISPVDTMQIKLVMKKNFNLEDVKTVAVCAGPMISYYMQSHYNYDFEITEFGQVKGCLNAVAEGRIDAAIVNANGIESELNSSASFENLIAIEAGDNAYRSISCKQGNIALYMLMTRGINLLGQNYIRTLVARYNTIETDFSVRSFLSRNIGKIIATIVILVLFVVGIILLMGRKRVTKLRKISEMDLMTGVMNRAGEGKIKKLIADNKPGLFILFDVDQFKLMNDTYGYDGGDEVLKTIAKVLKKEFSDSDIVYRVGGDEFGIFVRGLCDYTEACERLERLIRKISEIRLSIINEELISISIGASFCIEKNMLPFYALFKNANDGCFESKRTQGSAYTFK